MPQRVPVVPIAVRPSISIFGSMRGKVVCSDELTNCTPEKGHQDRRATPHPLRDGKAKLWDGKEREESSQHEEHPGHHPRHRDPNLVVRQRVERYRKETADEYPQADVEVEDYRLCSCPLHAGELDEEKKRMGRSVSKYLQVRASPRLALLGSLFAGNAAWRAASNRARSDSPFWK